MLTSCTAEGGSPVRARLSLISAASVRLEGMGSRPPRRPQSHRNGQ